MPDPHPLLRSLEQLCDLADAEFARGRAVHGERILCAAGCSSCCSQLFQITEVEAARIAAHVEGLPAAERERLRSKAAAYLPRRAEILADEQWGDLAPGRGELCPALTEDGACGIYEARPVMCRKFGVPIFNPDKPDRVMACELNFKPGEAIEDPELVERQTALYRAQQALQAAWNESGGGRDERPWCVGRALAEDARGLMPDREPDKD